MSKENFIKAMELKKSGDIEKGIVFLESVKEEERDIWDYFALAILYQAFGLIKESYWNITNIFDIIKKHTSLLPEDLEAIDLFIKEFDNMPLISLPEDEEGRKHYILAMKYKESGFIDKAEKSFRKSVTLSYGRNLEKVLLSFSQFYSEIGKIDEAIKLLTRATKIVKGDENIARIEYRLATFYEKKGNYEKSYELYKKVQERVPEYLDLEEKIAHVKNILENGGNQ